MKMRIVPWMTDDSVGFLNGYMSAFAKRTKRWPRILEFGMGASTLFFAFRSEVLVSFDHDPHWFEKIVKILAIEDYRHERAYRVNRPYAKEIADRVGSEQFDIISIDGRDRVECLKQCLKLELLTQTGVLIIDNTERISGENGRYGEMIPLLRDAFHCVHFEQAGLDRTGWMAGHRWITTVASRRNAPQYTSIGNIL